jgi:hypothetical protein
MVFELSPGEVVYIGDDVTLTVLTIEDDLICVGLESPEGCPGADLGCEEADLKPQRGSAGSRSTAPSCPTPTG